MTGGRGWIWVRKHLIQLSQRGKFRRGFNHFLNEKSWDGKTNIQDI